MSFRLPFQVRVDLAMLGLLLASGMGLPLPAHAGEGAHSGEQPVTGIVTPADSGPQALKQHVRVTVDINTPTAEAATNGIVPKEKSFNWKSSWEGWNGLHLELTRKTALGRILPGVTNIEQQTLGKLTGLPTLGTNTYRLRLEEGKMTANIGGKFALDGAAFVTGREFQSFDAGVELRRARIYAKGDCLLVLPVSYQIEIGYIPNQFYIEESYLLFRNLPWIGELKAGQYQAPMGLDVIASSHNITFLEPAAPLQALAPGVNAGLQVGRPVFNQRATWKLGLFADGVGQDYGDATKDYGRAIIRLTGLPLYRANSEQPDSTKLLHLGLSANVLYSASSSVRYRSRPESHLAPYVIDTGDIAADRALMVGAEAAWVNGPFSMQGEYLHSSVRENNGQVPGFNGFYASASWFLTGESRPYDRTEGMFGRVIPRKDFNWGKGGSGAWEIAGRYSFVNLNSADVHGGRLSMLMAGVNWYLHSHVKWRFDYGFGRVSGQSPEGNLNVFETRMEVDF
jgi:phosphate-selective porin OprO/OprP